MRDQLKKEIFERVEKFVELDHPVKPFVPGESPVPVSGRVYGANEVKTLVEASLEFWLTTGRFNAAFEKKLEDFLGARHVLTVNSGSSANLLSVATLTSHTLEDRALRAGDEVISVAASFPTTVNPLLLYGLIPVFVDIEIPTYNIVAGAVEAAITDKTKAIMLAHTLGNPFHLDEVVRLAKKYNLWLIEDCCDALGSTYGSQRVGTFGDIGTLSFYPAHHITMGEGGAVFTNNTHLKKIIESMRDWGRDCWCEPGKDNTCGKRFEWELGELPYGYDHKYIYSHAGFNLKITDMQAAVGLAQMDRLEKFIALRKRNFSLLKKHLQSVQEYLILPEATVQSDPSWFGFPITIREEAPFEMPKLIGYLNQKKIGTRQLFAGNLTAQPYFAKQKYRVSGGLEATDRVMSRTFWVGVYPGLTEEMVDYMGDVMVTFCGDYRRP